MLLEWFIISHSYLVNHQQIFTTHFNCPSKQLYLINDVIRNCMHNYVCDGVFWDELVPWASSAASIDINTIQKAILLLRT